jgi:hypothetical protein
VSRFGNEERIMRSDVRALLRPLVRAVGLFVAVAVVVIACLLVLVVMVRGSYAEGLPSLAGPAIVPSVVLLVARRVGKAVREFFTLFSGAVLQRDARRELDSQQFRAAPRTCGRFGAFLSLR